MTDDYVIRVPAEWVSVEGADAWIDADRLAGQDGRPFQIVGKVPADALQVRMDYERPLQPGETRDVGCGNSVHMHVAHGPCICGETIPPRQTKS